MEVSKKWIEEHTLSDAQMQALRNDPAADARQKMWDEASAAQRAAADQKLIVMSVGNGSVVNIPDENGSSSKNHLRYQADRIGSGTFNNLDIYQKLQLKDPAKSSMFDLLPLKHVPGETAADKMSAPFTEAKSYAKTAQDLFSKGQVGGKLSETALEKLSHDPQISSAERAVAANLKLNYDLLKGKPETSYLSKLGLSSSSKELTINDFERLAHTAKITDLSAEHSELHHSPDLLSAGDTLLAKNQDKPLTKEFLAEVSQSMDEKKYTGQERAAAELLKQNYEMLGSIDNEPGIGFGDLQALTSTYWWAERLKTSTPNELSYISDPESLRGTGGYAVRPPAPKRDLRAERLATPYTSSSSSGCHAVASGAVYGLAVYGILSALGTKGAAGYGMAAGAAQTYSAASRCQN